MEALTTMVVIIFQYVSVSNQHVVLTILYLNYISVQLWVGGRYKDI